MIPKPLGFAGQLHQTSRTRHGWSRALQLAPDLYPGVGGKRFRATLVQRAYEFAGGAGAAPSQMIDAVEMLHAGSLVIDDFEDGSQTRRDQPSLHRLIGAARAVNAGNWMYFRALELAGAACDDPAGRGQLLSQFIEVARQCHEGQAIDLSTRADELTPRQTLATALAISRWKTGRLVSLAAWCGAHAAGGDADALRNAAAFGCRIGICLQMKNDFDELVAFCNGAERCDDLRNRRVSWPWAWAAQLTPEEQFVSFQRRLTRCHRDLAMVRELACELLAIIHDHGGNQIRARLQRASDLLISGATAAHEPHLLAEVADVLRVAKDTEVAEASR